MPCSEFNEHHLWTRKGCARYLSPVANPSITVITPLLNRAAMLPDALASLATQAGGDVEHIVVDGGSTDGSQKVARAAGATVIDAPGSSIYAAINLGLENARGELIWLLNSDDRLAPGAFDAAGTAFASGALDLVRGRAQVEQWRDEHWVLSDDGKAQDPALSLRGVLLDPSNINACVFRVSLARRIGAFDSAYPISADREWLARALLDSARTAAVDATLYVYRAHAGSVTIGGAKPATLQWVREHLAFTRRFLQRPDLRPADRAALQAFHAKESAHLAVLQLAQGELSAGDLAASFGASPLWPLHAVSPLATIAARRLKRAFSA